MKNSIIKKVFKKYYEEAINNYYYFLEKKDEENMHDCMITWTTIIILANELGFNDIQEDEYKDKIPSFIINDKNGL